MGCIFSYAQAFKKKYAFFILESSCKSTPEEIFVPIWAMLMFCPLYFPVSTSYLYICVPLLGFLKTRGWVDSCAMVYWRRDLRKRKVGGVEWSREWNWARLWPPADPRRLWSMSSTTELVPHVLRESVSHIPLCGGGVGKVCRNLQMRRI